MSLLEFFDEIGPVLKRCVSVEISFRFQEGTDGVEGQEKGEGRFEVLRVVTPVMVEMAGYALSTFLQGLLALFFCYRHSELTNGRKCGFNMAPN